MQDNTPISSFDRTKIITNTAIKVGVKKAFGKITKKDSDDEIADILFDNISLLKGTIVKITQALALHNVLPTKLQKKLANSYNNITPLNRALVIKILKNEYKKDYRDIFDSFDLVAFASASLGQVHKATLKDGTKVAVKIQYPSQDKSIKSDIKLIKSLMAFNKNFLIVVDEIEQRLYEEIDYEKELQNTEWAKKHYKDIIIPSTYKQYSTKHILTTSYIDGYDLHKWLSKDISQKDKEKIANDIFKIFVESIFLHKKIQADPNPANFIITTDKQLTMIDFGCMKVFDDIFIQRYINIIHSYISTDKESVLSTYKDIGIIKDIDDIDDDLFDKILEFNKWSIEPFMHNEYKFSKDYLDYGVKFADLFTKKPFNVIQDFVFIDRSFHGLYSLFWQMDTTIDMRLFREYVGLK
jgi:predicted unusual protein kinase regulating ubiquinone biosynthesis (AarF/ABC1/UbiB family)